MYNHSPEIASEFLSGLVEVPISIGLAIWQQQKKLDAIPDGTVSQSSFKILIEAKVDASLNLDQLLRHCKGFSNEEQQILLFLTKQQLKQNEFEKIKNAIASKFPKVIFRNITYESICKACDGLFRDHEPQMQALVDDYVEYCNDTKLFDQSAHLLRIVPCGESIALNARYGMYFHPSNRGYTKHRFEGIYAGKKVQFLIEIESVFDVSLDGDKLKKTLVEGIDNDDYDERIKSMVKDAKIECRYEIAKDHRFFCGEIAPTCFNKSSPNGIQGARLIDLKKLIGSVSSLADVAEKLKRETWK